MGANAPEVIAEGLKFPEGPVVMADGSVIVVELAAGRVTRCWNGRTEVVSECGGGPNGAAIGPDGALYLCNSGGLDSVRFCNASGPGTEGRIERVDLATGKVERVFDSCGGQFPYQRTVNLPGSHGKILHVYPGTNIPRDASISQAADRYRCRNVLLHPRIRH